VVQRLCKFGNIIKYKRCMHIFSVHRGLVTLLVLMLSVGKKEFFWVGLEERELSWLKM
jgi:hypothetical protein